MKKFRSCPEAVQTLDVTPSRDWERAPWNHVRGAIRKYLQDWDPYNFYSPDDAQTNLNEWFDAVIERYVPLKSSKLIAPAPWWNYHCEKAFKLKSKTFISLSQDPDAYDRDVKRNKRVQRKAFKSYNAKLKKKIDSIGSTDRNFWKLIKDTSGLDSVKSSSAPDVEDIVDHFALK